jgi:hypothetical protein
VHRPPGSARARLAAATFVLLIPATTCASADPGPDVVPVAAWDSVLARFVEGGRVAYGALARDRGALDRFLAATESARPDGFSRESRLAFWVNAYNARVVDGVLRRPGLRSVLDPGKVLGVPTLRFFREPRLTAGRRLTLDDIEHRILRAEFGEPRVHFVLNCASAGCPELPPRSLTAASLDSVLEASAHAFLADRSKNRVGADGRLELSAIFKWFGEDFRAGPGGVEGFVARYGVAPAPAAAGREPRFLPYDWSLNGSWGSGR